MASIQHELRIRTLEADVAALKATARLPASTVLEGNEAPPMRVEDAGTLDDYIIQHHGHGVWIVARIVFRCDSKDKARAERAALTAPRDIAA